MRLDIRLILAKNLDSLMKEKRLNQIDVENLSLPYGRINRSTISTYLKTKGNLTDPKLTKIDVLASCFDLSPSELLDPNLGRYDLSKMTNETLNKHITNAIELLCEADVIKEHEINMAFLIAENLPNAIKVNIESEQETKQPIKKTLTSRLLGYFNKARGD
ncbi:helix-turn-helix domain-containing protein [uncultured Shewanella sp.]|uniref:helix-turn-helix domain-containing protein n=1 Tax=uncultured Shewanella sp. TaxID=173975 RepID=UPI00262BDF7A|nr:helix-turn-helix domain-containing protein [uncultured Shewanella sp.]